MDLTAVTRLGLGVFFFVVTGSASAQQLELGCPLDWSALGAIDGPNPDSIIYGLPAREWKAEHVDAMFEKELECAGSSTDSASIIQVRLENIQKQLYPNGLASIQRRDERLLQTQALAEQGAQAPAAPPAQDEPQQADYNAVASDVDEGEPGPAAAAVVETGPELSAAAQELPAEEKDRTWIVWLVLLLAAIAFCWQRFVRNRCANCRSTDIECVDETELDRWRGTKQVSEKNSRGTNTRHVQTTYVQIEFDYCCNKCQHEWSKVRKEELGSGSRFDRFLSGY